MNDEPDSLDARPDRNCPDDAAVADGDRRVDDRPARRLRSVVVEYDERPDRRTVYPDGLSSFERMSAWLTANDAAFVGLEDAR